jgi:hypothetical protein
MNAKLAFFKNLNNVRDNLQVHCFVLGFLEIQISNFGFEKKNNGCRNGLGTYWFKWLCLEKRKIQENGTNLYSKGVG